MADLKFAEIAKISSLLDCLAVIEEFYQAAFYNSSISTCNIPHIFFTLILQVNQLCWSGHRNVHLVKQQFSKYPTYGSFFLFYFENYFFFTKIINVAIGWNESFLIDHFVFGFQFSLQSTSALSATNASSLLSKNGLHNECHGKISPSFTIWLRTHTQVSSFSSQTFSQSSAADFWAPCFLQTNKSISHLINEDGWKKRKFVKVVEARANR